MNESEESRVKITVNLAAMLGGLQIKLKYANELLRFGLVAEVAGLDDVNRASPTGITYAIGGAEIEDLEALRANFRSWVIANALRDSLEALLLYLDEVRRVAVLFSYGRNLSIVGTEWNMRLVEEQKQFHRAGLSKKFDLLRRIDATISAEFEDEVESINRARNCLVHRLGVVGQEDVNVSGGGLLVRWRRHQLFAETDGIETPISIGYVTPEDTRVLMRTNLPNSKRFRLGERIDFSWDEFGEISWTIYSIGINLQQKVNEFGRAKGVVDEPDQTS